MTSALSHWLFQTCDLSFKADILGKTPKIFRQVFAENETGFSLPQYEEALWAHESRLYDILRVHTEGGDVQLPRRALGKDLFRWSIDAYVNGATLVLNEVDTFNVWTADISRQLDILFESHTTANAFLTPANYGGFPPHFDTHDIFVVQTFGSKIWSVFDQEIDSPLMEQIHHIDASQLKTPLIDTELQAGDILYLPSGFVHCARASEVPSLHISFGVRPPKPVHFLQAALDVIAEDKVEFRRNILAESPEDRIGILTDCISVFSEELKRPYIQKKIKNRMEEINVTQMRPLAGKHFENAICAEFIDENTVVTRRAEIICSLQEKSDKILLTYPGIGVTASKDIKPGYLEFSALSYSILKFILSANTSFTAKDIPGPIGSDAKIDMIRILTQKGLLRLV